MHLHKIQTTEKRFKIIGAVSHLLQETKKNMMMYKARKVLKRLQGGTGFLMKDARLLKY